MRRPLLVILALLLPVLVFAGEKTVIRASVDYENGYINGYVEGKGRGNVIKYPLSKASYKDGHTNGLMLMLKSL
jgi:hypothetical protein